MLPRLTAATQIAFILAVPLLLALVPSVSPVRVADSGATVRGEG